MKSTGEDQQVLTARLEEPVPLLGLKAQALREVERIRVCARTRRLREIELRTPWQTLQVSADGVHYDPFAQAFRMSGCERHSKA